MNDIQKLNNIISSLEQQAGQVTEFSGVLSAVNDARLQIEASREQLQVTVDEQERFVTEHRNTLGRLETRVESVDSGFQEIGRRQASFVTENRSTLGRLETRVESLSKALEETGRRQASMAHSISSLDILSPRAFSEGIRASEQATLDRLSRLEAKLEKLVAVQESVHRNSKILLFLSTTAILATVIFSFVK